MEISENSKIENDWQACMSDLKYISRSVRPVFHGSMVFCDRTKPWSLISE